MKVLYHKKFNKHFEKLSPKLQNKVIEVIDWFRENPFDSRLRNHQLRSNMAGKHAISVTGDIRIIFEEHDNYVLVIMLDIETHNQVY